MTLLNLNFIWSFSSSFAYDKEIVVNRVRCKLQLVLYVHLSFCMYVKCTSQVDMNLYTQHDLISACQYSV